MKLTTEYTDFIGQTWTIVRERDILGRLLFKASIGDVRIYAYSMDRLREIFDAPE